ncbi:MAG: DUF305 domain-containing protein [Pseudomonadota bacterium]
MAIIATLGGCDKKGSDLTPEQEMNAIMEANSPFADAEIQMDDAMNKAVGINVGDTWARKMIEHHRGAIAIARQALKMNPDAHVAEMARATIEEQTREIAELQKLVAQGPSAPASADLYQPAIDKMHQAMMAATGTSLSQTFQRKMLEHHKGAVAMADVALAHGVTGLLRDEVVKAKTDHLKQSEAIDAMLRNEARFQAEPGSATRKPANNTVSTRPSG